jgi:beta-glucosidase
MPKLVPRRSALRLAGTAVSVPAAATAAVLFGDVDPGGRLTHPFPVSGERHPTGDDRLSSPRVSGRQEYTEGIHVGYRWYERKKVKPLFPFGHGMS